MSDKSLTFNYLDHIDALRAISVILVILFHLNTELFFFGYLGVDVFFVISGYVITNSIYQQQILKKKKILSFYIKRFKRLYPILFLVIISFLIFYTFLSPLSGNTNFYLGSSVSALFGISNFYFMNNEVNYFLSESVNPLLHTWSLGIEEQFYFIYPIFLITLFKFHKSSYEKIFLSIFLFVLLSSIAYYFGTGIISDFYFPLARFWELAIGCLIFFVPKVKSKFKNYLVIFLLTIFILCIINFNNAKNIQNLNIISTILTSLIIIYSKGIEKGEINILIRKSKLPYLGRLSYSLYLWHLPILYFCEIYFSGVSMYMIFFIITFGLSIFSYHVYETPLRRSNIIEIFFKNIAKYFPIYITVLIFIFVVFQNYNLKSQLSFLKKFNYPETKLSNFLLRLDYKYQNYLDTDCVNSNETLTCSSSSENSQVIYLTGDSHAAHFLPTIDGIKNIDTFYYNDIGNCEIIGKYFLDRKLINNKCSYDNNEFIKQFNKLNFEKKVIIVSLRLSEYLKSDWKIIEKYNQNKLNKIDFIKQKYLNFLNKFERYRIILVTTVPESQIHTEKCIFNEFLNKKVNLEIYSKCHFQKKIDIKRNRLIKSILEEISANKNNIFIFDPYEKLCPDNICHNYDTEKDFFMLHDKDHLSVEASKFLSDELKLFIDKI